MTTTTSEAGTRLASLDGLRGLASLAVVLTHVNLAAPRRPEATPASAATEPLGLVLGFLSDGGTAVCIFFILSGIVLTLPFRARATAARWVAYYPRRVLRLAIPVWASIALAIGWYLLVPPRSDDWLPEWVQNHDQPILLRPLLQALAMTRTTFLNSPLWTLTWELAFSLLLPAYVLLARRGRPARALAAGAAMAGIWFGARSGSGALVMLPQFMLGALLAADVGELSRRRMPAVTTLVVTTLAIVLTQLAAFIAWTRWDGVPGLEWPLRVVGSFLIVVVFLVSPGARALAGTRVVQWLGLISFSLYLVHEPLVVSLRLLAPQSVGYWGLVAVAVPSSLALAWLFHWAVERRAHTFSRHVGRVVERTLARREVAR